MAFRYRQKYFDANDALNIEDWNLNIKELAEEFNGYLDRDNFPNGSFGQAQIVSNAFTRVHFNDSGTNEAIDVTTLAWQKGSLCSLEVIATVDCILQVELGAENIWTGSVNDNYSVRHKVSVDGVTVAESGWQSSKQQNSCTWICGALPVSAGKHVIQHWAGVGSVDNGNDTAVSIPSTRPSLNVQDRQLLVIERRR
jgi:hypothetical protein